MDEKKRPAGLPEVHPQIVGYWDCKTCGRPDLQYVLTQTGGICWQCLQDNPVVKRANQLEVEHRGVVRKLHFRNRHKGSRHSVNAKIRTTVIKRALYRLRDRHYEEYMLLLQEERVAAGWPPQLAAEENVLANAVLTIEKRLRYLRYIPPEELDATTDTQGPA